MNTVSGTVSDVYVSGSLSGTGDLKYRIFPSVKYSSSKSCITEVGQSRQIVVRKSNPVFRTKIPWV